MALIEFKSVNKFYGDYHALRDINHKRSEKGQVVVLLGPSGSEIYPYPYNQRLGIE